MDRGIVGAAAIIEKATDCGKFRVGSFHFANLYLCFCAWCSCWSIYFYFENCFSFDIAGLVFQAKMALEIEIMSVSMDESEVSSPNYFHVK